MSVLPFRRKRAMSARGAMQFLREIGRDTGGVRVKSYTELADMLRWDRSRAWKTVQRWIKRGLATVEVDAGTGRMVVRVLPDPRAFERGRGPSRATKIRGPKRPKGNARAVAGGSGQGGVDDEDTSPERNSSSDAYYDPAREEQTMTAVSTAAADLPAETTTKPPSRPGSGSVTSRLDHASVRHRGGDGGGIGDVLPVARHGRLFDTSAVLIAFALSGVAAYFSVTGMVVLFPGASLAVVVMGTVMEGAKFIGAGWLAARWRWTPGIWRLALVGLLFGVEVINAAGVYSQLVAAHVGESASRAAAFAASDADAAGRIDLAQSRVADLDRRIGQIDSAVDATTRRGRGNSAMSLAADQRRNRSSLFAERDQAARELAGLRTGRTSDAARQRAAEADQAPIRYVSELLGWTDDPEAVVRRLVALLVICFDPLAIALVAATSIAIARRRWRGGSA